MTTTAVLPSRTVDDRPPESLQLPTLGAAAQRKRDKRDETNTSHSIKEIVVKRPTNEKGKRYSPTEKTPRRRGDGIFFYENEEDENEESKHNIKIRNPREKRSMMDPPGYNESGGNVSLSKQQHRSQDPETASSIHRRRKRFLEQRARHMMGSSEMPSKMDGTDSTASSSYHSSWVPTRRVDKDPANFPVYNYESQVQISKQTMQVRDRAVPQKSWRPDRHISDKRNSLADDDMDFSTTNEWVPSEFYRKRKPAQAMQTFPSGTPHVTTSSYYPSREKTRYQEYFQQQRQRQQLQQQILLQQELEAQKLQYQQMLKARSSYRPHQLPQQPPSIIHTITTATTPSTPTPENELSLVNTITTAGTGGNNTIPENDPAIRKSMASEMDLSDVVISSESETMKESFGDLKFKHRNSHSESTNFISLNDKLLPKNSGHDDSRDITKNSAENSRDRTRNSAESSTIQDSLISRRKSKKRWSDDSKDFREAEENSTVLDSIKRRPKDTNDGEASLQPSSLKKFLNNEYNLENHDDGFDESLLSSSLTQLDIPSRIIAIPTIFVRKSGASDITFDMDATRLAIESTLTSDEDVTWGSTIHNSIISQESAAMAYAAAAAKGINLDSSKESSNKESSKESTFNTGGIAYGSKESTFNTGGAAYESFIGSGTSGLTGKTLTANTLTDSGISGLTTGGIIGGKDAYGNIVPDRLSTLAEEVGARARRKMEDIPSEVSSFVDTLSQNRSANKQDSEGDSRRSSWHHRSNITTTSTMVSTKKVANKKSKFKPRRSSTSTLPSVGSFIPEESWDYGDDEDLDESDEDEESYEIEEVDSDETSGSGDGVEKLELDNKLSSILEVASRDISANNSREFSVESSREFSLANSRDIDSGDVESVDVESGKDIENGKDDGDHEDRSSVNNDDSEEDSEDKNDTDKAKNDQDEDEKSVSYHSFLMWESCVCLDIRCFERREDGSRGRFNPTLGVYVIIFLALMLISVWTGIGIVWFLRRPE